MIIARKSPLTGKTNTMDLDIIEYHLTLWKEGKNIQDAMPHLSPDEREFLITGYTAEDWKSIFGSNEEEDEQDN